jgi:hypothetical protein
MRRKGIKAENLKKLVRVLFGLSSVLNVEPTFPYQPYAKRKDGKQGDFL